MNISNKFLLALTCALSLPACGPADEGRQSAAEIAADAVTENALPAGTISGSVSYRERIALSPSAELNLRLEDVSLADAKAKIIAERNMVISSQVPISFELNYDPALINAGNRYAVRATIYDDGQMLFTTDTHYPVLTQNGGNTVELVLVRAGKAPPAEASLTNNDWLLISIGGEPVPAPENLDAPYLRLTTEGNIVQGFSGCNQFSGTWQLSDDVLSFGPLAMTMMACVDENAEARFMPELEKTNKYELRGRELVFFMDENELLRFNSRN